MAWHYNFSAPDGFRRVRDLPAAISTSRDLCRALADYYVLLVDHRPQTLGDIVTSRNFDCIQSGGVIRQLPGYVSVNETLYDAPVLFFRPLTRTDREAGAIVCIPSPTYKALAQYVSIRLQPSADDLCK